MDRLQRSLTCCGLGLLLVAPGCKLTRPEVPPGRPFAQDGRQRPPVQFSSESHPIDGAATANMMPDSAGNTKLAQSLGAGTGRTGDLGAIGGPGGSFGPPGTSGRPGDGIGTTTPAPTADDDVMPASSPPRRPSIEPIPSRAPAPLPDLSSPPASAPDLPPEVESGPAAPAGSQTLAPEPAPGSMGEPAALPSPN